MKYSWEHTERELDVWPAVADIFIGFLALVLVVVIVSYADVVDFAAGTRTPPPALEQFLRDFEMQFHNLEDPNKASNTAPEARKTGFSEVLIRFPASFLFEPCKFIPMSTATAELENLRNILNSHDDRIERVQITGHTDSDRPSADSDCSKLGITTNWQLSARRAITILEQLAPDDGHGVAPQKVWAAALGPYKPIVTPEVTPEDKQANRRIELLIKFWERPVPANR